MRLPSIGETFQGRYELRGELGRGGFAVVYRALDQLAQRDVAIKIIEPGSSGYAETMHSRFMREVRVLSSLRDPHTVTMFDFGETPDGLLYMVFEFIPGKDLEGVLRAGPMPQGDALYVVRQVLQSLREAHAAGLLHRDIKPANIRVFDYMGDPLRVKLLDFGIARQAEKGEGRITQEGAMIGTPQFMSPEQVFGAELTPASDLYSLGLVAYELLTGVAAVDAPSATEILMLQVNGPPIRLPQDVPVTPAVRSVVERMVQRDVHQRYQTAEDVMRALDLAEASASQPIPVARALPAEPPNRDPTPRSAPIAHHPRPGTTLDEGFQPAAPAAEDPRRRALSIMAALAALLVAGAFVAAVALVFSGDEPSPAPTVAPIALPQPEEQAAAPVPEPPETPPPDPHVEAFIDARRAVVTARSEAIQTVGEDPCDGRPLAAGLQTLRPGDATGVYIPRGYDGRVKMPVLLAFHDSRPVEPPRYFEGIAVQKFADEHGVIVVVPRSVFELFLSTAWANTSPDYLRSLIDAARSRLCTNDRVYAMGHGDGGIFLARARCEVPLSGIALVGVRETYTAPCAESGSPTILLTGERDFYNPIDLDGEFPAGCGNVRARSLADREEALREANGCGSRTKKWPAPSSRLECRAMQSCDVSTVSCVHPDGHHFPGYVATPPESMLPNSHCASNRMSIDPWPVFWKFWSENGVDVP